jgi:hypothetical protein
MLPIITIKSQLLTLTVDPIELRKGHHLLATVTVTTISDLHTRNVTPGTRTGRRNKKNPSIVKVRTLRSAVLLLYLISILSAGTANYTRAPGRGRFARLGGVSAWMGRAKWNKWNGEKGSP